ncbi:hypothetical protein ES708_31579 [subsurface metagenome]
MALIAITAPSSAEEGEEVSVSAYVENTRDRPYTFKTEIFAVPDLYPDYLIGGGQATLFPGDWKIYSASFTMPDCNTTVFVNVERWENNKWNYEGVASKVVSLKIPEPETFHLSVSVPSGGYVTPSSGDYLAYSTVTLRAYPYSGYQFTRWGGDASGTSTTYNLYMDSNKSVTAYFEKVPVPEEYAGTISRKQLEYDEARASIPVYDIPQGQRGLVHIRGRNDMSTSQRMGIYWFVADPDGMIAEEYGPAWEAWPYTGAGKEHEFIGGRFNLDREKYTMWVELLMNPDNPEIVDRYIGDLCTVAAAVPEAEFRGFGVTEYAKR